MSETDTLKAFEADLRAQHDAKTQAFTTAQKAADAAWATFEAADADLTQFRAKYGKVLRALYEKGQ